MKGKFFKFLSERQRSYLILTLICIFLYGFSLIPSVVNGPHFIGGNDFKAHAHLILNFFESFASGQIIPRTAVNPLIFNDAAYPTLDAPIFQYYGFFEGAIGIPFLALKFSPAISTIFAVLLIRIICSFILYEACLLLGASSKLGILVNLSFLLSPYTMSCFYSRGAIAESMAQSLLVLIIYGFILSNKEKYRAAILVYILAVACLALCHNIFFIYGLTLLGCLLIFSFSLRIILSGIAGISLGLLITAWQWLPAKETVNETVFGILASWKIPDVLMTETHSASWSGAIGLPETFTSSWNGIFESYHHFFTIGIWSIPFILFLLFSPKVNRRIALPILMASILFICLTYAPMSTYIFGNWLPGIFNVVQNSYRLLAFISLLSAISLAVAFPRLNKIAIYLLAILIISTQFPLMWKFMNLVGQDKVGVNEVLGAPINVYYSTPKILHRIRTESGLLDHNNLFSLSSENTHEFSLRVSGLTDLNTNNEAFIVSVSAENPKLITPITDALDLKRDFDITFDNIYPAAEAKFFRLVVRDKLSGLPASVVVPRGFYLYEGSKDHFITENMITRVVTGPYTRKFEVKPDFIVKNSVSKTNEWIFELPIVYTPLFIAYQNGMALRSYVDLNHRMRVAAPSPSDPIIVKYYLSYLAITLTISGISGLILVYFWAFFCPMRYRKFFDPTIS